MIDDSAKNDDMANLPMAIAPSIFPVSANLVKQIQG